jgi:hypothetical protein
MHGVILQLHTRFTILRYIQSCLEDASEPADVREMTKKQWLVSLSVNLLQSQLLQLQRLQLL